MSIKSLLQNRKAVAVVVLSGAVILGELGRFRLYQNVYISLLDLTALMFILCTIRPNVFKADFPRKYLAWIVLVFLMMIFTIALEVFSVPLRELVLASLYPLRWLLYSLIPIGYCALSGEREVSFAERSFSAIFVCLAILGFLQLVLFPNLGMLEQYGYDPHYLRLVSTWLDPNFIGPAFILGMLVIYGTACSGVYRKWVLITLLFAALVCTFSRSSYLMFAVSGITFALLRKSWRLAFLVLVGLGVIWIAFYIPRQNIEKSRNIDRVVSANSRLTSYMQGLRFYEEEPFFGIGYNLVRYEKRQHGMIVDPRDGGNSGAGIDSTWILVAATMGSIGLLTFSAFLIRTAYFIVDPVNNKSTKLFSSVRAIFRLTKSEHVMVAFLAGWAVHTWFVNSLFFPLLMTVWGIGFGLVMKRKTI